MKLIILNLVIKCWKKRTEKIVSRKRFPVGTIDYGNRYNTGVFDSSS